MTPIQQLFLGAGASKKTYLDDVFSTFLYTGTGSTRSINTSVDMSKGGLVWIKDRENGVDHNLYDTERGVGKYISSNLADAEDTSSPRLNAFNSNGFGLGGNSAVNGSGTDFSSWSFRKAKGFFTCLTYVGSGSNRLISHDLGSVPGFYMIKRLDTGSNWVCFHKDFWGANYYIVLNDPDSMVSESDISNATSPTSSTFSVGTDSKVNASGGSYICYLFAGGPSPAATARSLMFNNSNYLYPAASSDFAFGTGDFTVECWVRSLEAANRGIFSFHATAGFSSGNRLSLGHVGGSNDTWDLFRGSSNLTSSEHLLDSYQWYHVAVVRSSGVIKLYVNGTQVISSSDTTDYTYQHLSIGGYYSTGYLWNGYISNFRVVKGTAVYTSSFRPPTEPLTNINNTVLLCCNNVSPTGSTVSPTTITNSGSVTARTESPFDDSAAYIFGEEGNQSIIKCGSFSTTSSSANRNVELGWEPQWVLTKKIDGTSSWIVWDTMRGWTTAGVKDAVIKVNENNAEVETSDYGGPHATGFESNGTMGYSGEGIYIAIRRLDPLVQKPQLATDLFAMDTGGSSSTIPNYDSGFPVDWAWYRKPASSFSWWSGQRLTGDKLMTFTGQNAEGSGGTDIAWDSNTGWSKDSSQGSDYQSWMFKRHAGFDVVTDTSAQWVRHSLNRVPEMVIIKDRIGANSWFVWHKDLNGGGSNSIGYFLALNSTAAQANWGAVCPIGNTLPTATHFETDSDSAVRNANCIAFLFATTDVSKVGSYSGSGSSGNAQNIGFQPRFLFVKRTDDSGAWYVFDSLRTTSNPFRYQLELNTSNQQDFINKVTVSSTGWSFTDSNINESGSSYVYYAHA